MSGNNPVVTNCCSQTFASNVLITGWKLITTATMIEKI